MRRGLAAGLLATASACVGFTIRAPDECATTCQRAADCGFLPSALGWSEEGSISEALADCQRRCANSPTSDEEVAQIVACFASEGTAPPRWCVSASEDDAEYAALWDRCAAISACISREHRDEELRGDVALTVQVIEWSEYQLHLGLALADYPQTQQGDVRAIQSCQPALCSPAVCSSLECEIEAECLAGTGSDTGEGTGTGAGTDTGVDEACSERCELPEGEVCDTRLCRVGHLTISGFCEELAARKISLRVYERDRLPVVEVFEDVEAGINTKCETSTFEFKPDVYELSPGPIKVVAMVEGELAGATLAEFGYFEDGEAFDPAAVEPYCLEFIGPAVTVHAGAVEAVVPVADLVSLTKTKGTLWRRCTAQ